MIFAVVYCAWILPTFLTFWILNVINCQLISTLTVYVHLAVLLLSSLLRRPGSVNAGEARIPIPAWLRFMFHRRGALHRRLSRLAADEAKRAVEDLLKQLEVSHVEALAISVESKGAEPAPCILLPADDLLRLGRSTPALPPHLLFCQLWRWADLKTVDELKKLPMCKNLDSGLICCNPFHYCRLYKPETPPPYTRLSQEYPNKLEDSIPSEAVDSRFSSNLSGSSDSPRPWCNVAYWELSSRVGRLLPVVQPFINIFYDNLPHSDGLCLDTLAQSHQTDNTSIKQTRTKIGQGICIFKEDDVWLYNRSHFPIFVNSPTLDPPNTENLTVYKVLPGYSIKIFDYAKSINNQKLHDPSLLKDGPFDPYAVRVSFVKGFGSSNYSRRFITSCPCWLEVIFNVDR